MSQSNTNIVYVEQAVEAEKLLMGSILTQPSVIIHCTDIVTGSDFLQPTFGKLFDHIRRLFQSGEPIDDLAILTRSLKAAGLLSSLPDSDAMTMAEFGQLVNLVPNHANIKYHAEAVANASRLRELQSIGLELLSGLEALNPNVCDLVAKAQRRLHATSDTSRSNDFVDEAMLSAEALAELDRGQGVGIATGINSIDSKLGGLFNELTILAARPSVGKTAFAMSLARALAISGQRVLFVSLEMTREQIGHRALSMESRIPIAKIRNSKLEQRDREALARAQKQTQNRPLRFLCRSGLTVDQIQAAARTHASKFGLDCLIVDYLGLVKPTNSRGSRYEQVSQISNDLAIMAKQLAKPVICLAQLNRGAETDEPRLDHLRDSGAIEQDADNVWFLHRDRSSAQASLLVAKARQAQVGKLDLMFDSASCTFRDAATAKDWNANQYVGGFFAGSSSR